VALTGARPVAATNCLNFGNPEKPEIMAQLSSAIDGIAEACTVLETPITGGNVSLYNETKGVGIYPTPVLGIVGLVEDVTKVVPSSFQKSGDAIVMLWPIPSGEEPDPNKEVPFHNDDASRYVVAPPAGEVVEDGDAEEPEIQAEEELKIFGSSEFAHVCLGELWGQPPALDLEAESDLQILLQVLAEQSLVNSAKDISDGGIAVALAQSTFAHQIGATVEQDHSLLVHPTFGLFAEQASTVLVTADPTNLKQIEELADNYGFYAARIGTTGGDNLEISVFKETFVSASIESLRKPWAESLAATLHNEVLA
jgi:phosphoribosylformylglycinamidine (FGAM) synthase-like enzyme